MNGVSPVEQVLGPRLGLPEAPTLQALRQSEAGGRLLARVPDLAPDEVAPAVTLLRAVGGYAHAVDGLARRVALLRPGPCLGRWLRQDLIGLDLETLWEALPDQAAAGTCSACEPGFGLDLAEGLLGREALDRLGVLMAGGWVEPSGTGFAMPGPLRAHAAQRLSDSAWDGLKEAHVRYHVDQARRADAARRAGAAEAPHDPGRHANLAAALDHALGTGDTADIVTLASGLVAQDQTATRADLDLVNRALQSLRARDASPRERIELRLGRGRLLHRAGMTGAHHDAEECLDEAERLGFADLAARAIGALVVHRAHTGLLDEAEALLDRIGPTDHVRIAPRSMLVVGMARVDAGQPDRGEPLLIRALEGARRAGAQDLEGAALLLLGSIGADRRSAEAPRRLAESAERFLAVGHRSPAALARLVGWMVELDHGRPAHEVVAGIDALHTGARAEVTAARDGVAGMTLLAAGAWDEAVPRLEACVRAPLLPEHEHYAPVFRAALRAARALGGIDDGGPIEGDPRGLADALRIYEALALLARAGAALRDGRTPAADIDGLSASATPRGLEGRIARLAFDRAWDEVSALRKERARDAASLVVAADGSWFRPPQGQPVDLSSKKLLGRILVALAQARGANSEPVAPQTLIRAAWPEERLLARSALNRLRVALNALRNEGLRRWLLTRDGAYLLDPDVPVAFASEAGPERS